MIFLTMFELSQSRNVNNVISGNLTQHLSIVQRPHYITGNNRNELVSKKKIKNRK